MINKYITTQLIFYYILIFCVKINVTGMSNDFAVELKMAVQVLMLVFGHATVMMRLAHSLFTCKTSARQSVRKPLNGTN